MKINKSAVYWTLGVGAFVIAALLLAPQGLWNKIGETRDYARGYGRVVASNVHESWGSRRVENVRHVAAARTYRAPAPQTRRVPCTRWHKVKRGQTQWFLATAYNNQKNKQLWLRGMRKISGKHHNDSSLNVGESVCVRWNGTV